MADPVTSMWRDTNAFNELGIPAISYAPRSASHAARKSFQVEDLQDAALAYARIAMDLCNQDRPRGSPLGAHLEPRHRRESRRSPPTLTRFPVSGRGGHYATLGVAPDATQREIKAAYRRLARATHPDGRAGDPGGEREFKRIARAYEVLGDPQRRRAYDERLTRGRFAAPGTDGRASFTVDAGPVYHSDLGHHSDFYQAGDPLTIEEAAQRFGRDGGWLRRAVRTGRLPATRGPTGYLLRRRDVERLDRTAPRRRRVGPADETVDLDTRES